MENVVITFTVVQRYSRIPSSAHSRAFLVVDNWDDWFQFSTLYSLIVFDAEGEKHEIGGVKIGQFDMEKDQRRPEIPDTFDSLDEQFFSLGQDDSYYEGLNKLGDVVRDYILSSLRDVVADQDLFERASKEPGNVLGTS